MPQMLYHYSTFTVSHMAQASNFETVQRIGFDKGNKPELMGQSKRGPMVLVEKFIENKN